MLLGGTSELQINQLYRLSVDITICRLRSSRITQLSKASGLALQSRIVQLQPSPYKMSKT